MGSLSKGKRAGGRGPRLESHAVRLERERTQAITRRCAEAKVPQLAASLIANDCPIEQVDARIAGAQEIVAACELLGLPACADSMLARGITLEQAKAELFDLRAK